MIRDFGTDAVALITLIALCVVFVAVFCLSFFCLKDRKTIWNVLASSILVVVSYVFSFDHLFGLFLIVYGVSVIVLLYANLRTIATFVSGISASLLFKKKAKEDPKVAEMGEVYSKVALAVTTLAKQKIGAIITFERGDKLDDVIKSGSIINSPVSSELIQTIFYPGTRLHDGALIIRNGLLFAASVYYTPTTRPLNGKFGSRHRAAMGISEQTDALTVVVSEETGRISIAFGGELESVTPDNLLKTIETYMNIKKEDEASRKE